MQPRTTAGWLIITTFAILAALRPSDARAECATFDGSLHWTATLARPGYAMWVDLRGGGIEPL